MISKKICMVGAFAVGKTSLVRQFVESIFSEKYHTTIGVKIDKRQVEVKGEKVQLMLWDIEGVDIFTDLKPSYLRGASGIIIVIDGTRPNTIEVAKQIKNLVNQHLNQPKLLLLANKSDLRDNWQIQIDHLNALGFESTDIFATSAKNGENVEEAFQRLAYLCMEPEVTE